MYMINVYNIYNIYNIVKDIFILQYITIHYNSRKP